MKKFNVYDTVWVMEDNRPVQKIVYSVTESMDFWKKSTRFCYIVVNSHIGAGVGINKGEPCSEDDMFSSKEELISAIFK